MFTIYADDYVLWSTNIQDKRLTNPVVNLDVNKVGNASFKLLPGHPQYNYIEKLKTIVKVMQDGRTIFKGRVFTDDYTFHKIKTVKVEGVLGYLNDSIVRPYTFTGSVENYFNFLISQHNGQCEDNQKFKVGICTVTDPNDYIVRSSTQNPNTWQEINEKLIKNLGGYIRIRYEADGDYIDYIADYSNTSTQNIEYGVNLLDLTVETDLTGFANCIIPYGKKNELTGEKVTITSVNDGVDYVYDPVSVGKYGRIYEVVEWPDVTNAQNLLTKVRSYLADKVLMMTRIKARAIDLHYQDQNVRAFMIGDYVRVYSNPHEIHEVVLLASYHIPLDAPDKGEITLGVEKGSYVNSQGNTMTNKIEAVRREIGDNITSVVNQAIDPVKNQIVSETTSYINNAVDNSEKSTREMFREYVKTSEYEEYKQSVSTEFVHTADAFELMFKQITDRITRENGEINDNFSEIRKYIRFVDGSIILGEVGNNLSLKLSNDRISFLYNDAIEVAYINDKKLYITESEILDRIVIGNFAFIPRANGNLSFVKIGG